MKRTTLAIPELLWAELEGWLREADEVAGVLTARVIDDDAGITLLARHLHRAPEDTYLRRGPDGLSLGSSGWVPSIRQASERGEMAIFVHTHPHGEAVFSRLDGQVDEELWAPFTRLTGASLYGSLLIAGFPGNAKVAARLRQDNGTAGAITSVRVVGDRLVIYRLADGHSIGETHDRQLRALGQDGHHILQGLNVGVVGVGGTGSPIIEQLIRLGVGHIVAVDDDVVTPSTVSRGYGSGLADVGKPKVAVLAAHADRIGLDTTIEPVEANLRHREVVEKLRHCDVVFSSVDGHAARLILNRWAYWHLAPVIDVGVLISANADGTIASIDGRITWLAPGTACLLCRGRIDPTLARAEHLNPEERRRLAEQGYIPALEEPQPAIVTYTTLLAAMATTELLNRLFGLATSEPTEILTQIHSRTTSLNRRRPRPDCFCSTPDQWGQGLVDPYLDLTWLT